MNFIKNIVFSCLIALFVLSPGIADVKVEKKEGTKVKLDGKLQNNVEDEGKDNIQIVPAETVIVGERYKGLVSSKLTPPKDYKFGEVGTGTYVDVLDLLDGYHPLKLIDGSKRVQVARYFKPATAGQYPLKMEGNIVPDVGVGGGVGGRVEVQEPEKAKTWVWDAKVAKAGKLIVLTE